MVLAATEVVQTHLERPMLLLLDDPAAELDAESLGRLMAQVFDLGSQIVATSLAPDTLTFPEPPAMFHVEHGTLRQV
jgi:recombinational DNA repair ATPase RecF